LYSPTVWTAFHFLLYALHITYHANMTILVVDDNQKTLRYLKRALAKYGYTVVISDNAKDALSILSQTAIDLILADINMPEMDGFEFCRIVREQKGEEYLPLIFLTARSTVDDVATGLIAGADDYLTKPVHLKKLVEKIQEYAM
jgi:DNA-binding response OmpR family regulator